MKALRNVWYVMAVLFISMALTACSKDKNEEDEPTPPAVPGSELIGTWIEDDSSVPYRLVFNEGGTGSISFDVEARYTVTARQTFSWSVAVNANGQSYCNILTTSGDPILDDGRYLYIVIGRNMDFGSLRFSKSY